MNSNHQLIATLRTKCNMPPTLYELRQELTIWINNICNTEILEENLLSDLADGVILANLVQVIHKPTFQSMVIHKRVGVESIQAHENVMSFLKAITILGVPHSQQFRASDLAIQAQRNESVVYNCLLNLAQIAWTRFQIQPPKILQEQQKTHDINTNVIAVCSEKECTRKDPEPSFEISRLTLDSDTENVHDNSLQLAIPDDDEFDHAPMESIPSILNQERKLKKISTVHGDWDAYWKRLESKQST